MSTRQVTAWGPGAEEKLRALPGARQHDSQGGGVFTALVDLSGPGAGAKLRGALEQLFNRDFRVSDASDPRASPLFEETVSRAVAAAARVGATMLDRAQPLSDALTGAVGARMSFTAHAAALQKSLREAGLEVAQAGVRITVDAWLLPTPGPTTITEPAGDSVGPLGPQDAQQHPDLKDGS